MCQALYWKNLEGKRFSHGAYGMERQDKQVLNTDQSEKKKKKGI